MQSVQNVKEKAMRRENVQSQRRFADRILEGDKVNVLAGYQKVALGFGVLLLLCIIFLNLFVQYKNAQLTQEILLHQETIAEISTVSEGIQSEINQIINYEKIKEAANQNGMTLNHDQVREITKK